MSEIRLPVMLADQAAPFLAALGTLGLVAYELGDRDATLCWPDEGQGAVISTGIADSVSGLATELSAIAARMKERDELFPGCRPEFPPRKEGAGSDPTRRLPFDAAVGWAGLERVGDDPTGLPPWLRSVVVTNTATTESHKTPGIALRHPVFDAGPGTVSMSTTLVTARDAAVDDGAMSSSLAAGRRVAGNVAAYLDWRADRDASQAASAKDSTTVYGDPAMTWLGLMAIRLSTLVGSGDRAAGGLVPDVRSRVLRKALVWPVWRQPLRAGEVEVLLTHSAVLDLRDVVEKPPGGGRPQVVGVRVGGGDARTARGLRALGVTGVYTASRPNKGNMDGAYGPAVRVYPEA